jgi:hypothetical protein
MNFDAAADDERVILDGRQGWTVNETALEARYGAFRRAHQAPDFLLRQAGSDTGCNKFIGQPIERFVRIPSTSKGSGACGRPRRRALFAPAHRWIHRGPPSHRGPLSKIELAETLTRFWKDVPQSLVR